MSDLGYFRFIQIGRADVKTRGRVLGLSGRVRYATPFFKFTLLGWVVGRVRGHRTDVGHRTRLAPLASHLVCLQECLVASYNDMRRPLSHGSPISAT